MTYVNLAKRTTNIFKKLYRKTYEKIKILYINCTKLP